MPKIMLSPDSLRSASTTLTNCMNEQQEVINSVANLINEVVSDWEGDAQQGFIEAFERVRPVYESFAPDLSDFAKFLNDYSNSMEYIDLGGGREIRNSVQ